MKKLLFIAICSVSGLVLVSCDKESLESVSLVTNKLEKKGMYNAFAKQGDTIVVMPTTTTTEPGPGDEVVPIKPPKP